MFRSITSSFPPANFADARWSPSRRWRSASAQRHTGQAITSTPYWVSLAFPIRSCRPTPAMSNAISHSAIGSASCDAKRSRRGGQRPRLNSSRSCSAFAMPDEIRMTTPFRTHRRLDRKSSILLITFRSRIIDRSGYGVAEKDAYAIENLDSRTKTHTPGPACPPLRFAEPAFTTERPAPLRTPLPP
jgi:hypothetical protein